MHGVKQTQMKFIIVKWTFKKVLCNLGLILIDLVRYKALNGNAHDFETFAFVVLVLVISSNKDLFKYFLHWNTVLIRAWSRGGIWFHKGTSLG